MQGIPKYILENNKILDADGNIQDLSCDKEAVRSYFLDYINHNVYFTKTLREKLAYMIDREYYEADFLDKYTFKDISTVYKIAHNYKFRFPSYMSASKFYEGYALKDRHTGKFLELFEDRMVILSLYHADGDVEKAKRLLRNLMEQNFVPATPTMLNSGRAKRGELVSCFLMECGDSLNDISRIQEFAMHLSKVGGGVSINLSNLRAKGDPIKGQPGVCKGIVGVAKLLDNCFRYADQMGQRTGAGAVYSSIFHYDIEDFLATKKINADEDIRLKTLSIGVSIPDKFIELLKADRDMYVFSPYDVHKEYGILFADATANMNEWYDKFVENPNIRKKKLDPMKLLETIAQLQGQSGYPYIFFPDNVNKVNVFKDMPIKFSNLCSEILQPSICSSFADYDKREEDQVGLDISCNLSSLVMGNVIKNKKIEEAVNSAMDIMVSTSDKTNISAVPGVARANRLMHSVGLGVMGHHGFIAENYIPFGSDEDLELIDVFFSAVNYYTLKYSMNKAKETGEKFYKFEDTTYADGSYFKNRGAVLPKSDIIKKIFDGVDLPSDEDWKQLKKDVMKYGLYNSHRSAIAPTGSISYVTSATASILPIKQLVEERTYGNSKTYYPMPGADKYGFMYEDAYEIDNKKVIDVVATAQKHVDQGISMELCEKSERTTRDLLKDILYAHHVGIKTIYYIRTRKMKVQECLSCAV